MLYKKIFRYINIVSIIVTVGLLTGTPANAAATCTNYYQPNVAVPAGYGAAYDVFSNGTMLVQGDCGGATPKLLVGGTNQSQYIYKIGYAYKGGAWQQINLQGSGALIASNWYAGSAQGTLPFVASDLANWSYIVGYVCTWSGSAWKCGCADTTCSTGNWQLQAINSPTTGGGGGALSSSAQNLLAYLKSIAGVHTIAGQFLGPTTGDLAKIDQIAGMSSGKYPGLIGGDYWTLTNNPTIDCAFNVAAKDYWSKGGLVLVQEHGPNPQTRGGTWDAGIDYNALITPGTSVNQAFMGDLDQEANCLQQLKAAGVVVLFRPFHEMNGSWFWWGTTSGTDAQFIQLWKMTHDYLVNTKGLTNLLFVYSPNAGGNLLARYPGDTYTDIVGYDLYSNNPADDIAGYNALVGTGKPFIYAEFGACGPDCGNNSFNEQTLVNVLKQQMPKAVIWQQWWERWDMTNVSNTSGALNDPYVLNRGSISF